MGLGRRYRLSDLFALKTNFVLRSGKEIFGVRNPTRLNVRGWNEGARMLQCERYREEVWHWNIAPRKGRIHIYVCSLAEIQSKSSLYGQFFLRNHEYQLRYQSTQAKLQVKNRMLFGMEESVLIQELDPSHYQ